MVKHRKYNDEKIREIIKEYGFDLIDFITVNEIIAKDSDGYKYKFALSNLRAGRQPSKLQHNPFAIENIKTHLSIHCPTYKLLDTEYVNCKEKMRFICEKHIDKGIQYNSVDNIFHSGHYCKYCSYERMHDERVLPESELISLCESKNVRYVGRYIKDHDSIIQYICNEHKDKGIQEMVLYHFRDSDIPCHYCSISSGELRVRNFLDKHNIKYIQEMKFDDCVYKRKLRFDFYLPDHNSVIEYDGRQHFDPVIFWNGMDADKQLELVKERDKIKTQYCEDNNISMIRVKYQQYNKTEEILSSALLQ